jgi:hypothetical protein
MNPTQFSIDFVLAMLATWRVTHLLANEDGPWDLIFKMRAVLGASLAGQLMDCFKCLSLWVAVPAAFFVTRAPTMWFFVWLALSGAACILQRLAPERDAAQAGQEDPVTPEDSEGEMDHVLWTETVSSQECSVLGETCHAGKASGEPGGRQIFDGAFFNGTYGA